MNGSTDKKLKDLLSDIITVDDVLLIVKSNGVTSEMRINSLSIKQKDRWITIGDNDGPCHMHVNRNMIKKSGIHNGEKAGKDKFQREIF